MITEEMRKKAERELGETDDVVQTNMNEIKEWVRQQPFFTQSDGDLLLLNFLRGCKFDQSKAREKLIHYFSIKSNKCEVFRNRDPCSEDLQDILSKGILLPIVSDVMELVIVRWEHCDIKSIPLLNVLRVGFMMFDIFLHESSTCMIQGQTVIVDCKGMSFTYMMQFFPTLIRDLAYIIFKAYPSRINAFHLINCLSYMRLMFNLFKPFLPSKMISRVGGSLGYFANNCRGTKTKEEETTNFKILQCVKCKGEKMSWNQ